MKMRRILSIAVTLLLLFTFTACDEGEKALKPTESFYVNDFADVLDDADEKEILSKAVALNQKTTAQVVVVTVEDLGGEDAWEFALNLGREWGVGDKEANNGVVVLLSENDRKIEIAVGYGLEGAIPDSKAGRIIDRYGLEYLKQNNFSKGVKEIALAVINEVYVEYGQTPENYLPIDQIPVKSNNTSNNVKMIISWIIMIVIILIFLSLPRRTRRNIIFFGGLSGFRGGYGSAFTGRNSFGGGFGGRGFGGGGSFGGGGAGRGF